MFVPSLALSLLVFLTTALAQSVQNATYWECTTKPSSDEYVTCDPTTEGFLHSLNITKFELEGNISWPFYEYSCCKWNGMPTGASISCTEEPYAFAFDNFSFTARLPGKELGCWDKTRMGGAYAWLNGFKIDMSNRIVTGKCCERADKNAPNCYWRTGPTPNIVSNDSLARARETLQVDLTCGNGEIMTTVWYSETESSAHCCQVFPMTFLRPRFRGYKLDALDSYSLNENDTSVIQWDAPDDNVDKCDIAVFDYASGKSVANIDSNVPLGFQVYDLATKKGLANLKTQTMYYFAFSCKGNSQYPTSISSPLFRIV